MLLMIVAVGAVAVFGTVMISYLFARGSQPATVPHADFDPEYDELVAEGEAVEDERDTAWRDFDGRQVEKETRSSRVGESARRVIDTRVQHERATP